MGNKKSGILIRIRRTDPAFQDPSFDPVIEETLKGVHYSSSDLGSILQILGTIVQIILESFPDYFMGCHTCDLLDQSLEEVAPVQFMG